ncbi:hypothetical protein M1116_02050 [Patescibacteria group bacterium]|nr:hypothetical protein [Patescibacteria group bacterium]
MNKTWLRLTTIRLTRPDGSSEIVDLFRIGHLKPGNEECVVCGMPVSTNHPAYVFRFRNRNYGSIYIPAHPQHFPVAEERMARLQERLRTAYRLAPLQDLNDPFTQLLDKFKLRWYPVTQDTEVLVSV